MLEPVCTAFSLFSRRQNAFTSPVFLETSLRFYLDLQPLPGPVQAGGASGHRLSPRTLWQCTK